MPGTGLAAPDRVALGENSRMLVGGAPAIDFMVQVLNGLIVPNGNQALIRFANGTVDPGGQVIDVGDNMSGGFTESSRGQRKMMIAADCFWRAADNPFAFPPNFKELDETPRVLIWPDALNAPQNVFKCPIGFCEGYTITLAGTAEIRFSIRLSNQKYYYTPSRPDPNGLWA